MTDMCSSACRFCALAENTAASAIDRPWLAGNDFFAISSVGALVEGWSLICPREHSYNLKDHFKSADFWEFAGEAIEVVSRAYGPVVLFEHGSTCQDSATSCGTAHAHLHVVPIAVDLVKLVTEQDAGLTWQECTIDQIDTVVGDQEYLLMLSGSVSSSMKATVAKLTTGKSQFFRKVIADYLGRSSEFSYKTHPQAETSLHGALRLRAEAESTSSFAAAA